MPPVVYFEGAIASRTYFTPELMELKVKKATCNVFAIMFAMVVFPVPGGPHRIIDGIFPCSMAVLRILPRPARCSCPTRSSRVRGRIRSARGADEFIVQITENGSPSALSPSLCFGRGLELG